MSYFCYDSWFLFQKYVLRKIQAFFYVEKKSIKIPVDWSPQKGQHYLRGNLKLSKHFQINISFILPKYSMKIWAHELWS